MIMYIVLGCAYLVALDETPECPGTVLEAFAVISVELRRAPPCSSSVWILR